MKPGHPGRQSLPIGALRQLPGRSRAASIAGADSGERDEAAPAIVFRSAQATRNVTGAVPQASRFT